MATTAPTFTNAPEPVRLDGSKQDFIFNGVRHNTGVLDTRLEWEDADNKKISLSDALKGLAKQAFLRGSVLQTLSEGSLWLHIWLNPNSVGEAIYAPSYNADGVPTADKPWFCGPVNIGPRLNIGGEAAVDGEEFSSDYEFKFTKQPELVRSLAEYTNYLATGSATTTGSGTSGS